MRRTGFRFIVVLLALGAAVLAADPQELWRQGRSSYDQGKYAEALACFEKMQATSNHWRIQYNIGNCLFRLERYLPAKIAYARAWKTAPTQAPLLGNLAVVNARLGFEDELLKPDFLTRLIGGLGGYLPVRWSAVLLILSLWSLNLAVFFWMRRRLLRPARYAFVVSLLLVTVLAAHVCYNRSLAARQDLAVVEGDAVSLYSGPGLGNTALFSLPQGLIVKIRERGGQWLRVTAGKEVSGWIKADSLTVL